MLQWGKDDEMMMAMKLITVFANSTHYLPSCTAEHIHKGPHLAESGAQVPLLRDLVERPNGHDQTGDQQVGDGQRQHQVVAHCAKGSLEDDGRDDKYIS